MSAPASLWGGAKSASDDGVRHVHVRVVEEVARVPNLKVNAVRAVDPGERDRVAGEEDRRVLDPGGGSDERIFFRDREIPGEILEAGDDLEGPAVREIHEGGHREKLERGVPVHIDPAVHEGRKEGGAPRARREVRPVPDARVHGARRGDVREVAPAHVRGDGHLDADADGAPRLLYP